MSDDDGDRLIIQGYLDAMDKYKGKPSGFPPTDMDMELIQRDFFGLLDDEMEFSEASLAVCLREIADDFPPYSNGGYFLDGLANVLDSEASPWKLTLTRKKWAGKYRPVSDCQIEKALWALDALKIYEEKGWPTEAAISKIGEHLNLGRSTIFKLIKEGKRLEKLFAENPIFSESTDQE